MRTPMTKEAFLAILERHRKSGLSVKRFCKNEAYSTATYYYWKSKFCSSVTNVLAGSGSNHIEDFAPVSFPVSPSPFSSSSVEDSQKGLNAIMIEHPSGIKIHFRGSCGIKTAMRLITQLFSSHVLPQ